MTGTDGSPVEGLVAGLDAVGRTDLALAGGKGANLGELRRAGFAVPDGFVVATASYARTVEALGLDQVIVAGVAGGDGAAIRAAFGTVSVPGELAAAITGAYAELGGGPVAVRSSATAEDLPGAAFAGQQDTYLNVVGADAVLDAVRRCWGSLWTDRAIAYRARRGLDTGEVQIAVVVQRMVEAEFAGVMFTANPVTGERSEVVIDAGRGLGEAVVSGLVTPDHYVLDGHDTIRQRTPGRREVVIRPVPGGGVTHSTEATDPTPLPDQVVIGLAELGRSVAAHFGRPQDIEWAYDGGGRVWLVQARPMTALPPAPLRLGRARRAAGRQLMDYLTERPYPLDVSGWIEPGIGRMVARMLAEIPGLRVDFADMLPEVDEVVDRFVPPQPRPTRAALGAPARIGRRARRHDPATWMADPRYLRFDRQLAELHALDLPGLPWSGLLEVAPRAIAVADAVTDLRVDYLPRVMLDLLRLHATLRVLGLSRLSGVVTAGVPTRTEDANRALAGLAALVRSDPGVRTAVAEPDAAHLLARLEHDPGLAGFRAAWQAFLSEYGHRETRSPLLMTAPTWGDAPGTVLDLVRVLAAGTPAPAGPGRARADAALSRLLGHPLVRVTGSGPRVRRMIGAARAGIAFRDDTHFHATRVLPVLRRTWLEAGRRLAAAGVLHEAADVVHLRTAEIVAIADPDRLSAADTERLRDRVRRRAARRAELAGTPMIAAATLRPRREGRSAALVSGAPASGGRASGPVRVIRGPEQFGSLRPGEVLVCPYTNPAWTPLFGLAAAVVVDSGGPGSHAAIVAREYGIPAVMGTGTGTTQLTDGTTVTVDGDTGRVVAAPPPP